MSRAAAVRRGLLFAVRYEMRLWSALYRWIARKPPYGSGPGVAVFPYAGAATGLFGVFIGLSAVEIPILHLILPWQTARTISLIIGAYGLVWMIGLLATLRVYPHLLTPSALVVRNSLTLRVEIPWDAVAQVEVRRRSMPPGGSIQVEEAGDQRILSLAVASQTSVDVLLARPLTVDVKKAGTDPVTQIRLHADDPEALVAAARERLPSTAP
ncbi:hypothetical protein [Couchioplanes caeruleus]|uniref:Uncharacterized protein n=2 Tax=Couchioplanes caeruleus TaxID=56438 RepID=A0A1K0FBH9_9ACTN|nr:hypothetical protein [Couchioplanes caeruleus]OJF10197.1 hypothetical protein BG844_33365 [Couchioplanes caeruleus subsp. caeruleus]ROP34170.1 hypothetical protein EDD30_7247 [Couchioplanes caeruleus]